MRTVTVQAAAAERGAAVIVGPLPRSEVSEVIEGGTTRVPLVALKNEPLILLDIAPSRTYFTRILESAGITPNIAFSSPSLEVVRGLVGQGLGYSILVTRPFGDHSYAGEKLAVRPIAEEAERGVIALASLRQMRKTRLVSAFEAHCVEHFKALETGT